MATKEYQSSQLVKMFRLDIKPPAILKAEASGRIPIAKRRDRGQVKTRYWTVEDLPQIGAAFGKFSRPNETEVIASYVPKGGTGKTAWSFNFGRILALHGIRVLVVGLDFQCSVSKSFGINYNSSELPLSLYDVMVNSVAVDEIITKSDIPNLHFIPEKIGRAHV